METEDKDERKVATPEASFDRCTTAYRSVERIMLVSRGGNKYKTFRYPNRPAKLWDSFYRGDKDSGGIKYQINKQLHDDLAPICRMTREVSDDDPLIYLCANTDCARVATTQYFTTVRSTIWMISACNRERCGKIVNTLMTAMSQMTFKKPCLGCSTRVRVACCEMNLCNKCEHFLLSQPEGEGT